MRLADRASSEAFPWFEAFPSYFLRTTSVAALALAGAVGASERASAACVLTSGPGTATSPGTGAVVTCNTAPPNPFTQRIAAQSGSSNVRVHVLPGSIVSVSGGSGPSITVRNDSSATNDGTIATASTGGGGLGITGLRSSITNNGLIAVGTSSNDALSASGAFNALINAGTINLNALGSSGIVTSGATNDNTLVNTGTINQNAPNGFGISSLGSRDTIRNTGVISSFTGGSFGIMARGSSASITNSGRITTRGSSTPAVGSFGDGSTVVNASGGTITTTASFAFGLTASANRNSLTNAGTITTSGDFARAVDAAGSFNSLVNDGTITTSGLIAHGLYAAFGSSNTLTNNGTIGIRGNLANGISTAGSRSLLTNNGTIATTGIGSDGMTTFLGLNNTLENAGTITVRGAAANGMSALGNGHAVRNAGTIEAFGPSAVGVVVSGNMNTATNSGTILTHAGGSAGFGALGNENTLTSTGIITTSGQNSHGIIAFGSSNALTNSGMIATSGINAVGMGAVQGQSNSLVNSGTIGTQGASAPGMIVSGSDNVVTNSGRVETTGDNAEGLSLGSGTRNTAFNSGVVTARSGPGVFLATNAASPAIVIFPGFVIGPFPADTATLVNQPTGTITSQGTFAVLGGNGEDRVENFGRLATGVAGGTAVDLRNGNDTLLLGPTSVIAGNVLGGAGTDTFILGGTGTGVLDVSEIGLAAKYQGFELFRKEGVSTWTLTGSGNQDWTITQGTLRADTNSLQGNVSNSAALVFAQDFDGSYGGAIGGAGTLAKEGAGTVTLASDSSFTGATSVLAGGLLVNGALSGSTVNVLGGTLGGTGRVQGLAAASGGTVAPGVGGIGTLTVTGNASFAPGSVFRVDANAAGQSDRLAVEGAATLAGGTVQVLAAPGAFGSRTTFTIVSAQGGLTGTFSGATVNLPFLDPSLSTAGNYVVLTLTRNPTFLTRLALTGNQAGVARALDASPTDSPLFLAAVGLTAAEARSAFDLLSGEVHASAVTAAVEESRLVRDAALDRLRQLGTSGNAGAAQSAFASYAADLPGPRPAVAVPVRTIDPPVFAVWGQGFGSWGRTDGNAGTAALERSTGGFVLGADATFDERWRMGLAGGYTRTLIDVDARLSSGAIESVHGAIYGGANLGAVQLRAGAAIAGQDVTTTRAVAFRGFADSLRAGYDQTVLQAFGEAGYRMGFGAATVEPFGQLAALRLSSDGFREEGGAAALTGFGRTHEVGFSTLGVRAEARLASMPLVARGMLGWRHAFGNTMPTALLASGGGALPFLVAGAPVARDSLVAEAGLDYRIGPSATLGVSYAGALAEDARDHMLKGRFEVIF